MLMTKGALLPEAWIARATAPKCNGLHRLRRWRWDVQWASLTDSRFPGVLDSRLHHSSECGYTFTQVGAYIALGRRIVVRRRLPVRSGGGRS